MTRKFTIGICWFGALYCLGWLLLAIFWPPKGSGGMQFIPFMLAGIVYLFLCVPAWKLAGTKYQKTALVLAAASLVIYVGSLFTFVGWS
jgi:hypothetical protein